MPDASPPLHDPPSRDVVLWVRYYLETFAAEMEDRGHRGTAHVVRQYMNFHLPYPPPPEAS